MAQKYFMLVREGLTQRLNTTKGACWPIAETHRDAQKLRKLIGGPDVRVAEIGSIEGETVEGHILLAIEDGCQFIACIESWNKDGTPVWKTMPLK